MLGRRARRRFKCLQPLLQMRYLPTQLGHVGVAAVAVVVVGVVVVVATHHGPHKESHKEIAISQNKKLISL